jgi:hypothetical protein
MLPTISTKLWGKVQKFDIMRLLLSTSTGSKHVQKSWQEELDYFHAIDTDGKMFTDIIKMFREDRDKMHVVRTTLNAILMPTTKLLNQLRRTSIENYQKEPTFEDYQLEVAKEAKAFEHLFNGTVSFAVDYPQYRLDDVLNLMEYFHHIRPLSMKSGDQVFLCTCCDAYQNYCCVESTALSLLYNRELEVPDIARLQQIKEREKALLANPFTTKRIKDKKKMEDKAKEKAAPKWKPHMPVYVSCAPGSAVDMATQRGKLTSRTAESAPAQDPKPVQPTPVDPKTVHHKTVDPMPKLPKTVDLKARARRGLGKKVRCFLVLCTFACT